MFRLRPYTFTKLILASYMVRESCGSTTHTYMTFYNRGIFVDELRQDFLACAWGRISKQRGLQATNIINTTAFLTACIMKEILFDRPSLHALAKKTRSVPFLHNTSWKDPTWRLSSSLDLWRYAWEDSSARSSQYFNIN